jgi:hypothetical protein
MSAERLRPVLLPPLAPGPILQRRLSASGRPLASLEGPAALSPDGRRPGVSARAESPSARSPAEDAEGARGTSRLARPRPRVGHHPAKNLQVRVTGLAATTRLRERAVRRPSASARTPADAPSSASWSASDGGAGDGPRAGDQAGARVVVERSVLRPPIAFATFSVPPGERGDGPSRPGACGSLLFSSLWRVLGSCQEGTRWRQT